jgi:hypothetical protein
MSRSEFWECIYRYLILLLYCFYLNFYFSFKLIRDLYFLCNWFHSLIVSLNNFNFCSVSPFLLFYNLFSHNKQIKFIQNKYQKNICQSFDSLFEAYFGFEWIEILSSSKRAQPFNQIEALNTLSTEEMHLKSIKFESLSNRKIHFIRIIKFKIFKNQLLIP